jgi:hypothetical protein
VIRCHRPLPPAPAGSGSSPELRVLGVWPRSRSAPSQATTSAYMQALREAGATGLEPATSGVTGRRSNQLNYAPAGDPV